MPAKKAETNPVSEYIADNGTDGLITPSQLADLVSRDPKTVRAHLRKMAARNQAKLKGARWAIDETLATTVAAHYAQLDASEEEVAS